MRTIEWRDDHARLLDQTRLPHEVSYIDVRDVDTMIDAIRRLAVRGAPALGVAGGFGVGLAALAADREGRPAEFVRAEAERIAAARPTAVNLAWAVRRVLDRLDAGTAAVIDEAMAIAEEDVRANRALAARGADLLAELAPVPALRVHTHCNTGALACVEWGTALGIVRVLHERGRLASVTADETRPLLQGSRLTAFELAELGIEHRIVVDAAGPTVIARGLADAVVVGADRIAGNGDVANKIGTNPLALAPRLPARGRAVAVVVGADRIAGNGDVANKIGTYPLALAAARAGVPFVVAAPESTLDRTTPSGAEIEIEVRDEAEVLGLGGVATAPSASRALNLAFDVTPADLVTAIVTERRVIRPAAGERP